MGFQIKEKAAGRSALPAAKLEMTPSPLRAVGSYPPSGLETPTGRKPASKPYPPSGLEALTGRKPACKPYGLEAGLEAEPEASPSPSGRTFRTSLQDKSLEGRGDGRG